MRPSDRLRDRERSLCPSLAARLGNDHATYDGRTWDCVDAFDVGRGVCGGRRWRERGYGGERGERSWVIGRGGGIAFGGRERPVVGGATPPKPPTPGAQRRRAQ